MAAALEDRYHHGVHFLELGTICEVHDFLPELALSFHIREKQDEPLEKTLQTYLQDKHLLLILDNFEQIIEAAPQVSNLLGGAPNLNIMVSSREVLRLYEEHEYPLKPLQIPDFRIPESLQVLLRAEAVSLFVDRATSINPYFELTHENAADVVEICRLLEGLPLAIELAASRSRLFTPAIMAKKTCRGFLSATAWGP